VFTVHAFNGEGAVDARYEQWMEGDDDDRCELHALYMRACVRTHTHLRLQHALSPHVALAVRHTDADSTAGSVDGRLTCIRLVGVVVSTFPLCIVSFDEYLPGERVSCAHLYLDTIAGALNLGSANELVVDARRAREASGGGRIAVTYACQ
jgi:hypothetical protein